MAAPVFQPRDRVFTSGGRCGFITVAAPAQGCYSVLFPDDGSTSVYDADELTLVAAAEAPAAPPRQYRELGAQLGALVEAKQQAYGDSFGHAHKALEVLWPHGVPVEAYGDVLAIARVLDKLFRIANHKHAFGESPWQDIAGYALLAMARDMDEQPPATTPGETASAAADTEE